MSSRAVNVNSALNYIATRSGLPISVIRGWYANEEPNRSKILNVRSACNILDRMLKIGFDASMPIIEVTDEAEDVFNYDFNINLTLNNPYKIDLSNVRELKYFSVNFLGVDSDVDAEDFERSSESSYFISFSEYGTDLHVYKENNFMVFKIVSYDKTEEYLSIKVSIHSKPRVTNLIGTTWKFNDLLATGPDFDFQLNFNIRNDISITYDSLKYYSYYVYSQIRYSMDYVKNGDRTFAYVYEPSLPEAENWIMGPEFKIIHITGGDDATNPDVINWLEQNATMVVDNLPLACSSTTFRKLYNKAMTGRTWHIVSNTNNLLYGVNYRMLQETTLRTILVGGGGGGGGALKSNYDGSGSISSNKNTDGGPTYIFQNGLGFVSANGGKGATGIGPLTSTTNQNGNFGSNGSTLDTNITYRLGNKYIFLPGYGSGGGGGGTIRVSKNNHYEGTVGGSTDMNEGSNGACFGNVYMRASGGGGAGGTGYYTLGTDIIGLKVGTPGNGANVDSSDGQSGGLAGTLSGTVGSYSTGGAGGSAGGSQPGGAGGTSAGAGGSPGIATTDNGRASGGGGGASGCITLPTNTAFYANKLD